MGCATSKPEEGALEATTNSKVIDKELELEQIERRKLVKLLLLGTGDSGKSTVLKQMKLIYNKGLTPEELLSYQNAILHNILECAQTLVLAMDSLHIPYSFDPNAPSNQSAEDMDPSPHQTISRRSATSTKHTVQSKPLPVIQESIIPQKRRDKTARRAEQEYMSLIESGTAQPPYTTLADEILTADDGGEYGFSKDTPFPASLASAIRTIWADSGIQYCYSRRTEFQLPDACAYILNDIDRITDPGYVPTEEDILQTRVITLGVTETKLMVEGTPYRIFDFGGQRAERKKWAGYFEDVSTVLFLVALSAYDQVLYEDSRANRMIESLNVFSSLVNHPIFKKTGFILFLNKIDLFKEKLPHSPIITYFPDFTDANTYENGSRYFIKRFQALNQFKSRPIYIHLTWATDRSQISVILKAVHAIIIKANLQRAGLT